MQISTMADHEGACDDDNQTLRQVADRCCKKVYIGTAVLPKPLFVMDYDDECDAADEIDENDVGNVSIAQDKSSCCELVDL